MKQRVYRRENAGSFAGRRSVSASRRRAGKVEENVSNWIVSYRWSDLLHVSVTSIRNAEKRGFPSYHPDCRKTIIHRRDILDYFCGGCGY